ncbi:MAG: alpha/beta hydrolase [Candidatus Methanoplasma sp.]|jgi:pimeloyl-ACP methyl ester carboxylesterase|nr:alpha/beta hydrolase [Candidatus Methanoplasma sp.]
MPKETVGNIKMNYEVKGSGEPMVLITGLGGDISFWNGMVPLLSDRFKVIRFDNRGCGLTECPDGPFDIGTLAGDVVRLLDLLLIPKAHVLGWSMGGNIAQEIALGYPERVASLTLVSTYMRRPSRSSYMMNSMVESVRSGGDLEYLFRIMQSLCMTEESVAKMEKKGVYAPMRFSISLEQFVHQLAAVDGFDSRPRAKHIRVPTRVIHGKADIMVPPHMGEELAAEIEGADLVLIDGCGHTMPPKEYVKAFLEHAGKHPLR